MRKLIGRRQVTSTPREADTDGSLPTLQSGSDPPVASHQPISHDSPLVIGTPSPAVEARPIAELYRSVPYRPDTVADGWATPQFTVRAASVRGYLHRYNGTPRQDDFAIAYREKPERLVVAVADGVSAATQSHLGATIAARYAVQWITEHVDEGPSVLDWRELMRHCAWQLVEQAASLFPRSDDEAASPEHAESLFATTLTCAMVEFPEEGPAQAWVAGVGDSAAWVFDGLEFSRVWGGKSVDESPITSSAVSGLPQVPTALAATAVTLPPASVLLLGTDGFGDPLGPGTGEVGRTFASVLSMPPSILRFAHLLDFSRETFDDDRTLVAIWPNVRDGGRRG